MGCQPAKRRMYRCWVPVVEGVWAPAVFANCLCNEKAALLLRTLGPTPVEGRWGREVLDGFAELRRLVARLNVEPWGVDALVASYKGPMRVKYAEAAASLVTDELCEDDLKLRGFLKAEKFNPWAKIAKPRLINPRSPRFNLRLARFLKPLECALWSRWTYGRGIPPTRVIGKGLNQEGRANLIRRKMEQIGNCTVFEVDGKAFEAHVSRGQLDLEHGVYKAAFPRDKELTWLLSAQRSLKGKTSGGIRYEREGCRASGDYNTGLGNSLLMAVFVGATIKIANLSKATYLVDGDNALLFVLTSEAAEFRGRFAPIMSSICGHEMTVEKPAVYPEGAVFGQSRPVETGRGWTMVRDVWKVLSGAFVGYRHYQDRVFAPRLIRAVAKAELALARGVPVLDAFFSECVRLTEGIRDLKDPSIFLEGHLLNVVDAGPTRVTSAARWSFNKAFGIGEGAQVALERRLVAALQQTFLHDITSATWLDNVVEDVNAAGAVQPDDLLGSLYAGAA